MDWPIEIKNDENIVRAICSPFHIKNGIQLKHQAFRPPAGSDEVSVMRPDWIRADACKIHAKNISNLNSNPPKQYEGLAVISAEKIRDTKAEVIDSRHLFQGHADIKHGCEFAIKKGEPEDPKVLEKLNERNKRLAEMANYHRDPNPTNNTWEGPPLIYKQS